MKRFAAFNPEHDLALANGDTHYLAPRNIREMAHDLAPLMDYLKWDTPWGWDAAIVDHLHKSGIPRHELPTDAMLAALRTRSERITAHHLLQQMLPLSNHLTGKSYVCRSLDDIMACATQHSHLLLKAPLSGSGKGLRHVKYLPLPPSQGGGISEPTEYSTNQKELSPFKGRSEAFSGLAKCQAVPSEGSAVLCATEADRERRDKETERRGCIEESGRQSTSTAKHLARPRTLTSALKKVESWADALIRRHGYLTAEPYYDKVQDFAMEFCVTDGRCHFIGYSLFTTDTHGRYESNLLLSDADIEARLSEYIPRNVLHDVGHFVQTHADLIVPPEWDTSRFPITFGIDMMVIHNSQFTIHNSAAQREQSQIYLSYAADARGASVATDETLVSQRSSNLLLFTRNLDAQHHNSEFSIQNSEFKLHPCVEINLRCNMGIVAHEVRRQLMHPESTGIYRLAIFADQAILQAFNEEQRTLYPALYRDGLLTQGYHPLISTENGARHLAYIIGKEV